MVSIIIPVFNGSDYLSEAIDSALKQTYDNCEVIVVNDGSDDNGKTREVAQSYGDKIRYFEKENGGVSTALNYGIERMRGDYFSWLSHDDIYAPEKVECQMDVLRSSNGEYAVYGDYEAIRMPGRVLVKHKSQLDIWGEKYICDGLMAVILGFISGCTLLIPKVFFEKYGLFDPKYRAVQDYLKWLEMFAEKRLLYVDRCIVKSRTHDAQQGKYLGKRRIEEEKILLKREIDTILKNNYLKSTASQAELISAVISRLYEPGDPFHEIEMYGKAIIKNLGKTESSHNKKYSSEVYRKLFLREICLYCVGKNGIRLNRILRDRGLKVSCFSDSDSSKWGTVIDGVRCISPSEIGEDSYIIVTKAGPDDVIELLTKQGFKDIDTFDNVFRDVVFLPIREENL